MLQLGGLRMMSGDHLQHDARASDTLTTTSFARRFRNKGSNHLEHQCCDCFEMMEIPR